MGILFDNGFYAIMKESDCTVIVGQGEDVTIQGEAEKAFLDRLAQIDDDAAIARLCSAELGKPQY